MLTGVTHKEADGCSRGASFEDAREKLHLVRLVATSSHSALPRTAATHLATHKIHIYDDACRHAVNHAAYARPVRLTKRSEAEKCTEGVQNECNVKIYKIKRELMN